MSRMRPRSGSPLPVNGWNWPPPSIHRPLSAPTHSCPRASRRTTATPVNGPGSRFARPSRTVAGGGPLIARGPSSVAAHKVPARSRPKLWLRTLYG